MPVFGVFSSTFIATKISGLNPVFTILWLSYVETCLGLFIVLNFKYLRKIGFVKKYILKIREKSRRFLRTKKRITAVYFLMISFVFLPIQGTGPIAAAVIGKLLGLNIILILSSIFIGAFLRFLILVLGLHLA